MGIAIVVPQRARGDVLVIDTCVRECSDDDLAVIRLIRGQLIELQRQMLARYARRPERSAVARGRRDTAPCRVAQLVNELKRGIEMWKQGQNKGV